MWCRIIIIAMIGRGTNKYLFVSENAESTKIPPEEFADYQRAEHKASGILLEMKTKLDISEQFSQYVVIPVAKPNFERAEELEKKTRLFLEPYFLNQFPLLVNSFHWQKAVENNSLDMKFNLGFSILLAYLEKDFPGWGKYVAENSVRKDEVISTTRKLFIEEYKKFLSSHEEAISAPN